MLAAVSALFISFAAVAPVSAQDAAGQAPDDSLAAHNRSVFERMFGGPEAPPAPDTVGITRIGSAADHPDRNHKAIYDVAFAHLEATRSLYRRRLMVEPRLKGEMMVVFRIRSDGGVDGVKVVSSSVDDGKLEHDVAAVIGTWRFLPIPAEHGDVTVAYPFRFNPE